MVSSPAVAGGVVYCGSRDGYFYAVDAARGAENWRFKMVEWADSSPAVAGDRVYVAGCNGYICALR